MTTLRNYIGGEWIAPGGVEFLDLTNPATGETLGKVPLSGARAVTEAVAAAQTAFLKWREVPPVVRARYPSSSNTSRGRRLADSRAPWTATTGRRWAVRGGGRRAGRA